MRNRFIRNEISFNFALKTAEFRLILLISLETACMVSSMYQSLLDERSQTYAREVCRLPNYFYEALAFNVSIAGEYSFWSYSDVNTYGYLYRDDFNPFQPLVNRLAEDDDSCNNKHFRITHRLLSNTKYILAVTTHGVNVTGTFSVMSAGPAAIQFVRSGEYCDCEVSSFGYWMMLE
jgi:hypothetical protein